MGSREPSPDRPIDAALLREVILTATGARSSVTIAAPDSAYAAAGRLDPYSAFTESVGPTDSGPPAERIAAKVPAAPVGWDWKTPRYTMTGYATFYDHGTTAMRLPRGTIVVICGARKCIDRVINDYGPVKPVRIVDLYRPDFFAICGCGWWSGTTTVTVSIY